MKDYHQHRHRCHPVSPQHIQQQTKTPRTPPQPPNQRLLQAIATPLHQHTTFPPPTTPLRAPQFPPATYAYSPQGPIPAPIEPSYESVRAHHQRSTYANRESRYNSDNRYEVAAKDPPAAPGPHAFLYNSNHQGITPLGMALMSPLARTVVFLTQERQDRVPGIRHITICTARTATALLRRLCLRMHTRPVTIRTALLVLKGVILPNTPRTMRTRHTLRNLCVHLTIHPTQRSRGITAAMTGQGGLIQRIEMSRERVPPRSMGHLGLKAGGRRMIRGRRPGRSGVREGGDEMWFGD